MIIHEDLNNNHLWSMEQNTINSSDNSGSNKP